jgi:hypothetical protein
MRAGFLAPLGGLASSCASIDIGSQFCWENVRLNGWLQPDLSQGTSSCGFAFAEPLFFITSTGARWT